MKRIHILNKHKTVLVLALILFIIPFFWLQSGEMDLGGDGNRLYFYDPVNFLKFTGLYSVSAIGRGIIEPSYIYLPYVALLGFLKLFFSSTTLINIVNGIKLSIGFLSAYLVVYELLKQKDSKNNTTLISITAVLSGLFYIVSFGSVHMAYFWDRALVTHNQIFINPLTFFLFLKFFSTEKYKYLWFAIMVSFVFAPNFGPMGAPWFFAFYPLGILFLCLYRKMFIKGAFPWQKILFALLLFIGIHAFHLISEVRSLISKGSIMNEIVFTKKGIIAGGLNYFSAVSGQGKAALSILVPSTNKVFQPLSFVVPFTIIIGMVFNKKEKKKMLLIAGFFVITFFLVTANITHTGLELYKKLFFIPGFSMFRVFHEKWSYVFIFFYSLLFGFALHNIIIKLKSKYIKPVSFLVFILLLTIGIPLLSGSLVNKKIIWGSTNTSVVIQMDPKYEQTLKYIRSLPNDKKFMVLPLTDFFRQLFAGANGGAYEGPSTLLHLSDKYSFTGYQHFGYDEFDPAPYAEDIMKYSRDGDYYRLLRIFNTLNIGYILHNEDPNIYEEQYYPGGPYFYMRTSMPKTQEAYKEFIKHFPLEKIYQNGSYVLYEMQKNTINPLIFVPHGVYIDRVLSFEEKYAQSVFIDKQNCKLENFTPLCSGEYLNADVDLSVEMINPSVYKIHIHVNKSFEHMFLVMQNIFHTDWKLKINDDTISGDTHIKVNGYANGWLINSQDLPQNQDYTLYIKLDTQRFFWYGLCITGFTLLIFATFVLKLLFFKRN